MGQKRKTFSNWAINKIVFLLLKINNKYRTSWVQDFFKNIFQQSKVSRMIHKTCICRGDIDSSSAGGGKCELRASFKAKWRSPAQRRHWMPFRGRRVRSESNALHTLRRGSSPFVERQKKHSPAPSIDGTLYLKHATWAQCPWLHLFCHIPLLAIFCNQTWLSYT